MTDPRILYKQESQGERLARKSKETPFFPIGELPFLSMLFSILAEPNY